MLIDEALRISRRRGWLRKSQYWPRERMDGYRLGKLRAMLEHSYENVPFYHEAFKSRGLKPSDIKTFADLSKLPVLTKADVIANMEKLRPRERGDASLESTGGSTAEPMNFYV